MWTENILDTELFESNDLTIIMWVPFPSTPRNNANFQQEPAKKGTDSYIISRNVDGKHAEIFSEWKSRLWSFSENVFVKFLKPNLDGGSGFFIVFEFISTVFRSYNDSITPSTGRIMRWKKKMLNSLKPNWGVTIEAYAIEFVTDTHRQPTRHLLLQIGGKQFYSYLVLTKLVVSKKTDTKERA